MRYLFILLAFCSFSALAQKNKNEPFNFRQYGYVYGQRIDTISSVYASAEINAGAAFLAGNSIKRFHLEYGQEWQEGKEPRITDAEGKVITFPSTAAALNFFDFNGWDVFHLIYGVGGGGQSIVLKKKTVKQ